MRINSQNLADLVSCCLPTNALGSVLLALGVVSFGAAPAYASDTDSVFEELRFTRVVYSAESRPDLVAGALRYAVSRAGQPVHLRLERAERLFRKAKGKAAIRNYKRLAYYGDKWAQYQIARIHAFGMGDLEADPIEALAWFALAAEHPDVHDAVESITAGIWSELDSSERDRARARVRQLARDYSNLALLDRVEEHLRRRMLERTGTRLANAKGGMLTSSEGIYEYDKIQREIRSVTTLLNQLGNVELGETVVLEPQAPAARDSLPEHDPSSTTRNRDQND